MYQKRVHQLVTYYMLARKAWCVMFKAEGLSVAEDWYLIDWFHPNCSTGGSIAAQGQPPVKGRPGSRRHAAKVQLVWFAEWPYPGVWAGLSSRAGKMLSGANQVPSGSVETKIVSVGCEAFGPDEPPRNVAKFVVNPQPQHEALRRENLGRCNICTTLLVYINMLESSWPAFALAWAVDNH